MVATIPSTVPSLDAIRERAAQKLVTIRPHSEAPALVIANYTPRCAYGRQWDEVTRACRGLILRLDAPLAEATAIEEVVALPFEKFFNVGELGAWPESPMAEVTIKADGCLGILYRLNGEHRVATRGSFHSVQATWATRFLRRFELSTLPDGLTLLWEIISPVSRICVDYGGRQDLLLLAVRNRFTGADWPYADVQALGERFGFSVIESAVGYEDILALVAAGQSLGIEQEGWVIRCGDGTRHKVKGAAYRELHRLLSHLSERAVVDALMAGSYDDLVARIPIDYQATAERWKAQIEHAATTKESAVRAAFAALPKGSRKEFALAATSDHRDDARYLFALLDGKEIRTMILENLRDEASPEPLVEPDAG